jgi:phage tail sheath gpL-like
MYVQVQFGVGLMSAGLIPQNCLLIGNKGSDGSSVANSDIVAIGSQEDVDTYLGLTSELAQMGPAALAATGVNLYAAPVTTATGAASTFTVTFSGSWTVAGTIYIRINGKTYTVNIATGDTTFTNAGDDLANAVNADPHCPFTLVNVAGTVTGTCDTIGVRGNEYLIGWDATLKPTGMVITFAGGSIIHGTSTSTIGLIPCSTGSGADDVTSVIALLKTKTWDFIAPAEHDNTAAGLLKAHVTAEAVSTIGHREHVIYGFNQARATTNTFAKSTLNDPRSSVISFLNSETYPACLAAALAAARAVRNPDNPNLNWDSYPYDGNGSLLYDPLPIFGQQWSSDIATHTTNKLDLATGTTPLTTNPDGTVMVVSAVQSHCLNGSAADYRILYWGEDTCPDRFALDMSVKYALIKADNPYDGPDNPPDQFPPGPGVFTPSYWYAELVDTLHQHETNNWAENVDTNLPVSAWDTNRKCVTSVAPYIVRTQNHQVGLIVRQTVAT